MNTHPKQIDLDSIVRERLSYDSETGVVSWNHDARGDLKAGRPYGRLNRYGYLVAGVGLGKRNQKQQLLAHRVAWFLHYGKWPGQCLDHRDRCRTNNRIDNLREVDAKINAQNRHISDTGGVLKRADDQFMASIRIDGWRYTLGTYSTREMASRVYLAVKREFHPGKEWELSTHPAAKAIPG